MRLTRYQVRVGLTGKNIARRDRVLVESVMALSPGEAVISTMSGIAPLDAYGFVTVTNPDAINSSFSVTGSAEGKYWDIVGRRA